MDRSTDKSEFKIKEDNMTMVWQTYQLIPSRDIDDQRILESDWTRATQLATPNQEW